MRPLWRRLLILKRLDLLFLSMCPGMVQNNREGGDKKLPFVRLDFRARKSKVCCKMLAPLESSALVDYETPLTFADRLSGCQATPC